VASVDQHCFEGDRMHWGDRWMVERVEGHTGYIIMYGGWESLAVDDVYHHTKHFRQRVVIIREHNPGFREHGHVAFGREERKANL
jgi:hypothetical protein